MDDSVTTSPTPQPPFELRELKTSDAEWILDACRDPDIRAFTSNGHIATQAAALDFIKNSGVDKRSWAIVRSDGSPAGIITLHALDAESAVAEVGYWVAPWARRSGAARSAVQILEDNIHEMQGVSRFRLTIMKGNVASISFARSAGYAEVSDGVCSCGTQGDVSALIFEKSVAPTRPAS